MCESCKKQSPKLINHPPTEFCSGKGWHCSDCHIRIYTGRIPGIVIK